MIKLYFDSKLWNIEFCKYGKVIDKYEVNTMSNDFEHTYYYIIVLIDEKLFKIETTYSILDKTEINDEMMVFSIKGEQGLNITK